MKRLLFLQALPCLFLASCSVSEIENKNVVPQQEDVFFACSEHCSDTDTKVYVDENVKILWDEDDRITIFNKFSYNQEYRFAGDAGDNSGAFKKVPNDDFVTGNELDNIFAVYPYQESTRISNRSVLTVSLPTEQLYRENSFGRGANVMTSAGNDNMLRFRNIGGFLVLKFYGVDVSVSSIRLEGNNAEPLSGRATVTQEVGTNPSVIMATSAEPSITLSCETPVALGGTKEDAVAFWFVLPPTEFSKGFTLTVTNENGDTFVKKTERKMTVNRNGVLRISPIEVVIEPNSSAPVPTAIDLGLSVKWASFNLGAKKPEEYGDYYAWGETTPYYSSQNPVTWYEGKSAGYDWTSYKWCKGTYNSMTKYNTGLGYADEEEYNEELDNKVVLDATDDAATVNWGGTWRTPTATEWDRLRDKSLFDWEWVDDYHDSGVAGVLITSKISGYEGNRLFLPSAGFRDNVSLKLPEWGFYWSSSLRESATYRAMSLNFYNPNEYGLYVRLRYCGLLIRPVSE